MSSKTKPDTESALQKFEERTLRLLDDAIFSRDLFSLVTAASHIIVLLQTRYSCGRTLSNMALVERTFTVASLLIKHEEYHQYGIYLLGAMIRVSSEKPFAHDCRSVHLADTLFKPPCDELDLIDKGRLVPPGSLHDEQIAKSYTSSLNKISSLDGFLMSCYGFYHAQPNSALQGRCLARCVQDANMMDIDVVETVSNLMSFHKKKGDHAAAPSVPDYNARTIREKFEIS